MLKPNSLHVEEQSSRIAGGKYRPIFEWDLQLAMRKSEGRSVFGTALAVLQAYVNRDACLV